MVKKNFLINPLIIFLLFSLLKKTFNLNLIFLKHNFKNKISRYKYILFYFFWWFEKILFKRFKFFFILVQSNLNKNKNILKLINGFLNFRNYKNINNVYFLISYCLRVSFQKKSKIFNNFYKIDNLNFLNILNYLFLLVFFEIKVFKFYNNNILNKGFSKLLNFYNKSIFNTLLLDFQIKSYLTYKKKKRLILIDNIFLSFNDFYNLYSNKIKKKFFYKNQKNYSDVFYFFIVKNFFNNTVKKGKRNYSYKLFKYIFLAFKKQNNLYPLFTLLKVLIRSTTPLDLIKIKKSTKYYNIFMPIKNTRQNKLGVKFFIKQCKQTKVKPFFTNFFNVVNKFDYDNMLASDFKKDHYEKGLYDEAFLHFRWK